MPTVQMNMKKVCNAQQLLLKDGEVINSLRILLTDAI
jgi:hypothetical protein